MSNSFITSVGKGKYNIEYETTDKQNYLLVEEICRLFIDRSEMFKLQQEIERLNNIINKGIEAINVYQNEKTLSVGYEDLKRIRGILQGNDFDLRMFEEYLQELKGVDKE